jgi:histidine ammonia-lyase
MSALVVAAPADLHAAAVLAIADGARVRLDPALVDRLAGSRATTLAALADSGPVYGVTTGMGNQSGLGIGIPDQPAYQGDLMLARAVGTAP